MREAAVAYYKTKPAIVISPLRGEIRRLNSPRRRWPEAFDESCRLIRT